LVPTVLKIKLKKKKKNLKNLPVLVEGFKLFERRSSPVLDLVLHISMPPLQGSFFKN
jgi:hypothetical protein